ncbi:hypothetical protein [Methanobacterium sp.]
MNLEDLELECVREFMAEEVNLDVAKGILFMSKLLKYDLKCNYTALLHES